MTDIGTDRADAGPPIRHRRPPRRVVWYLAAVLACLIGLAVYLRYAPTAREKALSKATFSELQTRVAQDPNDALSLYYLGKKQVALGNLPGALVSFRDAMTKSPDKADAWVAAAETAEQLEGIQAGLQTLDAFLKVHPDSAPAHMAAGQMARRARQWERAYTEAQSVVKLDPKDALAWHLAGQAAGMTGRINEAGPDIRRAYELNPRNWETQTSMGDLLVQEKKYAEAAPRYREAIRLSPDKAIPYLGLAQSILKANPDSRALEEARDALLKCRQLRPDIPTVALSLGQCYSQMGRWQEAKQELEESRRRDPSNMDVYFELGKVYERLGETAASKAAFDRHRQLVVFSDERKVLAARVEREAQSGRRREADALRLELARKLARNDMYGEALEHYGRLLAASPKDRLLQAEAVSVKRRAFHVDEAVARGNEMLHRKQFPQAAQAFQAALSIDGEDAKAWEGLGTALASASQTPKALAAFVEATRRDPERPWAQLALGEAFQQIGLSEEASRRLRYAQGNPATRSAATALASKPQPTGSGGDLAAYSHLAVQLIKNPADVDAKTRMETLQARLKASGDLPPLDVIAPLLHAAAGK